MLLTSAWTLWFPPSLSSSSAEKVIAGRLRCGSPQGSDRALCVSVGEWEGGALGGGSLPPGVWIMDVCSVRNKYQGQVVCLETGEAADVEMITLSCQARSTLGSCAI